MTAQPASEIPGTAPPPRGPILPVTLPGPATIAEAVTEAVAEVVAEVVDPAVPAPGSGAVLDPHTPLSDEGRALLDRGRGAEAVEVLRRAVASAEPGAADLLVRAYLDTGAWSAVIELLSPLVAEGNTAFAGRLGVAFAEFGDRVRAEEMLRAAVAAGELAAANDLALLLAEDRRLREAAQVLADAADHGDPTAPDNLVALHLEDGDLTGAAAVAERYVNEARPDTLVALADVRTVQRREDEAEALYRRAGELGAVRAHTAYGGFLVARGDVTAAEHEFREAERHNEPRWAVTIGRFLVDVGRPEVARWYLEIGTGQGDREAAALLAELNGEDPSDD
jgi:tetratricopeptide (TPR) repeat protein